MMKQQLGVVAFLIFEMAWATSSYCYDNCSHHGTCVDFICLCDPGWFGENCGLTYGSRLPLSQGTQNLTTLTQATDFLSQHEVSLIGFSSRSCLACAKIEDEYEHTDFHGIPFARVDSLFHKELALALTADERVFALPAIFLFWQHGKRKNMYSGPHTREALSAFTESRTRFSVPYISDSLEGIPTTPAAAVVIGIFTSLTEDSEDMEDFEHVALELFHRYDLRFYLHLSTQTKLPWYPPKHVHLPAIMLRTPSGHVQFQSLETLTNLVEWIQSCVFKDMNNNKAINGAVPLSEKSFYWAEERKLPMVLLFSPSQEQLAPLLPSFLKTAQELHHRFSFLFDASGRYKDKMAELRLDPAHVSLAINPLGGAPVPFQGPVIDSAVFSRFCHEFLLGKIFSRHELEQPVNTDDSVPNEDDIVGVRESISSSSALIPDVSSLALWSTVGLNESQDVVVFVHRAKSCLPCKELAPYFRKMAQRLEALRMSAHHAIVCVALDLDRFVPSSLVASNTLTVPRILMFPKGNKSPPHVSFQGQAKVFPMMEWVRTNAGKQFVWPEDLPQFDAQEKALFKEQIRMRELARRTKSDL